MKPDQVWIDVPIAHLRDGTLPLLSIATGQPVQGLVTIRSRRGPLRVPLGRGDRQFRVLGPLARLVVAATAAGALAFAAAVVGYSAGAAVTITAQTWVSLLVMVFVPLSTFGALIALDPPAWRVRVVEHGTRAKLLVHQRFVDAVLPPRPSTWLARWKPGPYNYRGRGAAVLTVAPPDAPPSVDDVIDLRLD